MCVNLCVRFICACLLSRKSSCTLARVCVSQIYQFVILLDGHQARSKNRLHWFCVQTKFPTIRVFEHKKYCFHTSSRKSQTLIQSNACCYALNTRWEEQSDHSHYNFRKITRIDFLLARIDLFFPRPARDSAPKKRKRAKNQPSTNPVPEGSSDDDVLMTYESSSFL